MTNVEEAQGTDRYKYGLPVLIEIGEFKAGQAVMRADYNWAKFIYHELMKLAVHL